MTKNKLFLLLFLLAPGLWAKDMAKTCQEKGWKLIDNKEELYAYCAPPTVDAYFSGVSSKRRIKTGYGEHDAYMILVDDESPGTSDSLEDYESLRKNSIGGLPEYEVQEVIADKDISTSKNLIIKKFVFRGLTDLGGIGAEGPPHPRPVHVGLYLAQNKTSGWTYYIYLELDTAHLTVTEQKEAWELLHSILSTFVFYDSAPKSPDKKEEPRK